jgi:two-component system, chemotaxis family, protein-glutamate methylesterase/glutaminase
LKLVPVHAVCARVDTETIREICSSQEVTAENRIVVIGASAGGVSALKSLINAFDPDWPVSVFVTLHSGSKSILPDILNWSAPILVQFAEHESAFNSGCVYVAPPDRHLLIGATTTLLSAGPKENHTRPAIDPMFRSAAYHHGTRVIGLLLTGYLHDGINGLHDIHSHGGCTIVQNPSDAQVPELPRNALRRLNPDYVLSITEMPKAIAEELSQRSDVRVRRRT